ncbi:MAG: hypothetical protein KKA70_11745 [Proteobacteria bacterium]|nr:hypothetical protein [Pseudomonadota bacterium]
MGRKRKKEFEKLPPYVYLAKGRYIWRPYEDGKLGKEIRLCNEKASFAEIWSAYETITGQERNTLRWLLNEYTISDQYGKLASSTRKVMEYQKNIICSTQLRDGRNFGTLPLKLISPGLIRKYLDKRAKTAPIMGNREIALISMAWSWARERDICGENPCLGVRKIQETPRDRYVTDDEYKLVYKLAIKTAPPYIPIGMEIAFLCRARLGEILDLQDTNLLEDGLLLQRSKKSKTQIITWSPRLKAAIKAAQKLKGVSWRKYILHNKHGLRIKEHAFKSAWQRLIHRCLEKGLEERFTFHDLKAKGVSDFEGDKQLASGHKTAAMVEVYDRKPKNVNATR